MSTVRLDAALPIDFWERPWNPISLTGRFARIAALANFRVHQLPTAITPCEPELLLFVKRQSGWRTKGNSEFARNKLRIGIATDWRKWLLHSGLQDRQKIFLGRMHLQSRQIVSLSIKEPFVCSQERAQCEWYLFAGRLSGLACLCWRRVCILSWDICATCQWLREPMDDHTGRPERKNASWSKI